MDWSPIACQAIAKDLERTGQLMDWSPLACQTEIPPSLEVEKCILLPS